MRKFGFIGLPLLLVLFLFQTACKSKKSAQTGAENKAGTIMFYNVENLFDTADDPDKNDNEFLPGTKKDWTQERYNTKLLKLSQVISQKGDHLPDLLGLCELENRTVINDLLATERLSPKKYAVVHKDSPDQRGIDCALVYDSTIFTLIKTDFLEVLMPNKDNRETRDILYAALERNGETVHVFVNHWPSRYGGQEKSEPKRMAAMKTLVTKIKRVYEEEPQANFILMGDFNDYPDNRSLLELLEADPNLVNLASKLHTMDRGSYNYKDNWGFLDQIIVSASFFDKRGLRILPNTFHEVKLDWMLFTNDKGVQYPSKTYGGPNYYGGFSDHLPVEVNFE